MRLAKRCRKSLLTRIFLSALTLCGSPAQASQVISFSAKIIEGSCDMSLNNNVLTIGTFPASTLTNNALLGTQYFTLTVQDCTVLTPPNLNVAGDGIERNGLWLFRDSASTSQNVGVMVFRGSPPSSINDSSAIRTGVPLNLPDLGSEPYPINFYARITCGYDCSAVAAGSVQATLAFTFLYL